MGSGVSFKCPHCNEEIVFLYGVGDCRFNNDKSLEEEILHGKYGAELQLLLKSLHEKFSEASKYCQIVERLRSQRGRISAEMYKAFGAYIPKQVVSVYKDSCGDTYYQCNKCDHLQRSKGICFCVDDGLISFNIRRDLPNCEICNGDLHEIEAVYPEDKDEEDSLLVENIPISVSFICPHCHQEIKDYSLSNTGIVEWD